MKSSRHPSSGKRLHLEVLETRVLLTSVPTAPLPITSQSFAEVLPTRIARAALPVGPRSIVEIAPTPLALKPDGLGSNPTASPVDPASAQAADANFDCRVDELDFDIWNQNRFMNGTNHRSGDFNGDGVTDVSDFNIWNLNKHTDVVDDDNAFIVHTRVLAIDRPNPTSVSLEFDDGSDELMHSLFAGRSDLQVGDEESVCLPSDAEIRIRVEEQIVNVNNKVTDSTDAIVLVNGDDIDRVINHLYGVANPQGIIDTLADHLDGNGIVSLPEGSFVTMYELDGKDTTGSLSNDFLDLVLVSESEVPVQVEQLAYASKSGELFFDGGPGAEVTEALYAFSTAFDNNVGEPGILWDKTDPDTSITEIRAMVAMLPERRGNRVNYPALRIDSVAFAEADYFANITTPVAGGINLVANNVPAYVPSGLDVLPELIPHTVLTDVPVYDMRFDNFDIGSGLDDPLPVGRYIVVFAGNYDPFGDGLTLLGAAGNANGTLPGPQGVFSVDTTGFDPFPRQYVDNKFMLGLITEKTLLHTELVGL